MSFDKPVRKVQRSRELQLGIANIPVERVISGEITTDMIDDRAIIASKIGPYVKILPDILPNSIISRHFVANSIDYTKFDSSTILIDSDHIAADTIVSANYGDEVDADSISLQITAGNIITGAITPIIFTTNGLSFGENTITNGNFADDGITNVNIPTNMISDGHLIDGYEFVSAGDTATGSYVPMLSFITPGTDVTASTVTNHAEYMVFGDLVEVHGYFESDGVFTSTVAPSGGLLINLPYASSNTSNMIVAGTGIGIGIDNVIRPFGEIASGGSQLSVWTYDDDGVNARVNFSSLDSPLIVQWSGYYLK